MPPRGLHSNAKRLRDHESDGNVAESEEYAASRFGGFEEYFKFKQIKLQTQDRDTTAVVSQIYKGLVFYITGYTEPSSLKLKHLIVSNSGTICSYMGGKTYASYIVAESLTARKIEQFGEYKVVKPAWIVECCAAGRLLDWFPFRTINKSKGHYDFAGGISTSDLTTALPTDSSTSPVMDPVADAQPSALGMPSIQDRLAPAAAAGFSDDAVILPPEDESAENQEMEWSCDKDPITVEDQRKCIMLQRKKYNCMDPNFLRLYYARSRLHLLSTSKLQLRKRCQNAVSSKNNSKRSRSETPTIVHVDFDAFFASASLLKCPELANKPICVSYGGPSSDVASCNYIARAKGVKNGQWVRRAKESCPDLVCLPYDFDLYKQISDKFYDTILEMDPDQIVPLSIDEALLDLSSTAYSEKSLAQLCIQLREKVKKRTGLDVSVGVAPNVLGARMALKLAKPAGQRIFNSTTEISNAIASMDIESLPGVGRQLAQKLRTFQVNQIKDLERFSLSHLVNSFGSILGQQLYDGVRGLDNKSLANMDSAPKSVSVEVAWGVRFLESDEVYTFLERLVTDLWSRLTHKPCVVTVKLMTKGANQPFVPPKFMGSGFCDIQTRSAQAETPTSQGTLRCQTAYLLSLMTFNPLMVRGVGVHLKLTDVLLGAPEAEQQKLIDSVFKRQSPRKSGLPPPVMVQLSPRRRQAGKLLNTLTQMQNRWDYGGYSKDVKHMALVEDGLRKPTALRYNTEKAVSPYIPLEFMQTSDISDLRILLSCWVRSAPQPYQEDAYDFMEYVKHLLEKDRNWMKAIELTEWLRIVTKPLNHVLWLPLIAACQALIDEAKETKLN